MKYKYTSRVYNIDVSIIINNWFDKNSNYTKLLKYSLCIYEIIEMRLSHDKELINNV